MIHMYARAKGLFARRELDWRATPATAYLVDTTHVPDLEADTQFDGFQPAVLAAVALNNQSVETAGWCAADPLVFVGLTLPRPCGQAVIAATDPADPIALLLIEFPPLSAATAGTTVDNFTLLWSQRGPGWFRL